MARVTLALLVALALFAVTGMFVLSACQTYQPPGEGIWRSL